MNKLFRLLLPLIGLLLVNAPQVGIAGEFNSSRFEGTLPFEEQLEVPFLLTSEGCEINQHYIQDNLLGVHIPLLGNVLNKNGIHTYQGLWLHSYVKFSFLYEPNMLKVLQREGVRRYVPRAMVELSYQPSPEVGSYLVYTYDLYKTSTGFFSWEPWKPARHTMSLGLDAESPQYGLIVHLNAHLLCKQAWPEGTKMLVGRQLWNIEILAERQELWKIEGKISPRLNNRRIFVGPYYKCIRHFGVPLKYWGGSIEGASQLTDKMWGFIKYSYDSYDNSRFVLGITLGGLKSREVTYLTPDHFL